MNKIMLFLLLFVPLSSMAQQLILQGSILYERKENMHKMFDEDDDNSWAEAMKKTLPKYRVDLFALTFNSQQSVYKMYQEHEGMGATNFWRVAYRNTVQVDFSKHSIIDEKNVYERDYLVVDSLPQLKWKLTGEYREIAGYNCRKASTIIMDSVYVIAFYTDAIPVSGGPELFNGLPGMAMGIVIPRMNLTFFATKVETQLPDPKVFTVKPTKGSKTVTFKQYQEELLKDIKNWGKDNMKIFWKAML
ncbi:MAG TPA: GLPGLI family protein [Bacteroidetes bacterium]|nr:GLPGLI family protein [Bacteroidota bacterium]